MRAIAEVATAVTKGDLTRSITVEASGEVAALKDNINEMIRNLKDTTQKNTEQDWLKTNLAKFTRMLQGQRDLATVSKLILSRARAARERAAGVFYVTRQHDGEHVLELLASYAAPKRRRPPTTRSRLGEGLVGQCAVEKQRILLTDAPHDYMRDQLRPRRGARRSNIIVLPVLFEGQVKAVIELASFDRFSEIHRCSSTSSPRRSASCSTRIAANMRTEELLAAVAVARPRSCRASRRS